MTLRIVVADDIPQSLKTIKDVLRGAFDVVGEANDGTAALGTIRKFRPDVAILDLSMPGLNGIEVTRRVLADQPNLAVVICSVHQDPQLINAAVDAGARGYIFKLDLLRDLVPAVEALAHGQSFLPAGIKIL